MWKMLHNITPNDVNLQIRQRMGLGWKEVVPRVPGGKIIVGQLIKIYMRNLKNLDTLMYSGDVSLKVTLTPE